MGMDAGGATTRIVTSPPSPLADTAPPQSGGEKPLPVQAVHRRRAMLWGLGSLVALLWMSGVFPTAPRGWLAAPMGIGLLSAFALLAASRRFSAALSHPVAVASWLVFDAVLLTWGVHLTGGVSSPWMLWYITNAGTASVVAGRRAAVSMAAVDSMLLLVLAAVTGPGWSAVATGALYLAVMWTASFYFLRGVADLQTRRLELEHMRRALDRSLDEMTRMTSTLDQRTRELADANLRIREADRLKSQFVSSMSHELRTPLNSIIGFSEILLGRMREEFAPKHQRFLQNINEAGHQLLGLINDILDLSKIDSGKLELMPEPLVVQTLIEGVSTVLSSTAKRRSITLETFAPADLPLLVADPVKVKQIVYNLVANAIKFSHEGGRVVIEARRVESAESPLGADALQIVVTDQGVGIDPEHHRLIFQEFAQVDGSTSRPFSGAGLGLALVRRFVELHHGTISLHSALGEGATFTVSLPLAADAPACEAPPVPTLDLPAESGRRILVIEDDPTAYETIASRLAAASYVPVRAATCEEALALVHTVRPVAITLDLVLPGADGWEVLRQLKADPATHRIPVVIVSMLDNRELGLSMGADDFFPKPVDGQRLVQRLAELVPATGHESLRVLVIDDDPHLHELLDAKLGRRGFVLDHALTGQAGIAQARVRAPHVIILDLMMEGLDGFEVAAILRQDTRTAEVPIIVFTAKDIGSGDRARLSGKIDACVEKGRTTGSGIVPVIQDVLRRRAREVHRAGR